MCRRRPRRCIARWLAVLASLAALLIAQGEGGPRASAGGAPDARCYSAATPPAGSLASVTAHAPTGVYLWLDAAAWHIRVVDAQPAATFTGEISACSPIQEASYLLIAGDQIRPLGDAEAFSLTPGGELDGFEFNADCPTTWTFSFDLDGTPVPPAEISVGALGVHPASSIFALPSCPSSAVAPVGVRTRSITAADFTTVSASGLHMIPALALPPVTSSWPQLDLPVRSRRLYGDPEAAAATPLRDRPAHRLLGAFALLAEAGLAVLVVAAWFLARRPRGYRP